MTRARERRWVDGAERWYRLLLAVSFPRAFRESYGPEASSAFRDQVRARFRAGGPRAVIGACAAAVPRVIWEGVSERWDALFSGYDRVRGWEPSRASGGVEMVLIDLRHAWRGLRSNPRFAVAMVLTFALAVGVNTTVFSFVRGILLRPLPMADADRVVLVGQRYEEAEPPSGVTSPPAVRTLREEASTLTGVAAFAWADGVLTGHGDPIRVSGAQVGPGYLATLGQPPVLGREFSAEEEGPAAPPVVLISHRMWRTRFGGEPTVLGRTVRLDGETREIVGVLPATLIGPHDLAFGAAADFLVPMWWNADDHNLGYRVVRAVARLSTGATVEAANAELGALSEGLTEANPDYGTQRLGVMPIREYYVGGGRSILLLLQAAVALVLLIGAVNVMNMALARGVERRQGLAVRAAMGAGRGALIRSVLFEVVLAAVLGGILGALLATGLVRGLLLLAPAHLPQMEWVRVDALTLAGGAAFTLAAALLAGIVPALRLVAGGGIGTFTGEGSRTTAGTPHRRLLGGLAAAQVALAVALLVGAGLLVRSFASLVAVELGYDPEGVHVLQVDLPSDRYPGPGARVRFVHALAEALEARPEVVAAAFGSTAPQRGLNNFSSGVGVVGRDEEEDGGNPWAYYRAVEPGYLDVLGVRIVEGRDLHARDRVVADSFADLDLRAAVVNAEFARRFLPDGALGTRLVVWGDTVAVVGVAEPTRHAYPGAEPEPELYIPNDGRMGTMTLVVRGQGGGAAGAVREVVRAADAGIPVEPLPALMDLVSAALAAPRLLMVLVGGMAAVALGIAAVGVYGLLSFVVARRRTEIGLRLALGAAPRDVLGMLLRQGVGIVAVGLAVGLALAWAGSRVLANSLYGVGPRDPAVFAAVTVALGVIAVIASWLPALRAARVDPVRTLREG